MLNTLLNIWGWPFAVAAASDFIVALFALLEFWFIIMLILGIIKVLTNA